MGRAYVGATTLARTADVACERCGCRYQYQLVRRGVGYASFGPRMAAWLARRRAERRLARDADLVACPDCGWFQADMVRSARRGWGRWALHAAWLVPLLAVLPVLGVWGYEMSGGTGRVTYAHLTPAEQAKVLTAVAVAAAAILLVPPGRWLLARLVVNPNRLYPDRPGPIPGAPAAVRLSDPPPLLPVDVRPVEPVADGTLGYARREPDVLPGGWVTVQLLGLTCPPVCARCLEPTARRQTFDADPTGRRTLGGVSTVPGPKPPDGWMPVPLGLCAACSRVKVAVGWPAAVITGVGMGAVVAGLLFAFTLRFGGGFADAGRRAAEVFAVVAPLATAIAGVSRAGVAPFNVRRYRPDRHTIEIRFENAGFTDVYAYHQRQRAATAAPPPADARLGRAELL